MGSQSGFGLQHMRRVWRLGWGSQLRSTFQKMGLAGPQMCMFGGVGVQASSSDPLHGNDHTEAQRYQVGSAGPALPPAD